MQLKFQQDFFIRDFRQSDRSEGVALIEKHQSSEAARSVEEKAEKEQVDPAHLFRTILNSNGVLIGTYRISRGRLNLLAVNPNFMKKELKEAVFGDLREWCMAHTGGKLSFGSGLIAGAWKTFFKQAGAKIASDLSTGKWIEF